MNRIFSKENQHKDSHLKILLFKKNKMMKNYKPKKISKLEKVCLMQLKK